MYSEAALPAGAAAWRSHGGTGAVIPADGCVDLIVRGGRVLVAGPSTAPIATLPDGETGSFGLRIPPGAAGPVLRTGLADLTDHLIPLEDATDPGTARRLREVVLPFGDGPHPARLLAELASGADARDPRAALVRRHAIAGSPAPRVARAAGISERSFRRWMPSAFGYGYATLVRLERSRRAQALLRGGVSVAEAAARAGYADQPHLSREFRRLVGRSPAQFAASGA